ncbi:MAG: heavy metal transporter [Planctomycetaceae bacterium]|nr:heavy metal transporter [Planctomycetaceae bacterium]
MLAVVAAVIFAVIGSARAADPATTTITVPELDCPTCAKKVAAKLSEIPGVGKIESSVEAKTFTITAKAGAAPSPKAMWEAVEKGGFDPSKLVGPSGTFTTKPTS